MISQASNGQPTRSQVPTLSTFEEGRSLRDFEHPNAGMFTDSTVMSTPLHHHPSLLPTIIQSFSMNPYGFPHFQVPGVGPVAGHPLWNHPGFSLVPSRDALALAHLQTSHPLSGGMFGGQMLPFPPANYPNPFIFSPAVAQFPPFPLRQPPFPPPAALMQYPASSRTISTSTSFYQPFPAPLTSMHTQHSPWVAPLSQNVAAPAVVATFSPRSLPPTASAPNATIANIVVPTAESRQGSNSPADAQDSSTHEAVPTKRKRPASPPVVGTPPRAPGTPQQDLQRTDLSDKEDQEDTVNNSELEALPSSHPKAQHVCKVAGCEQGFRTYFGLARHSKIHEVGRPHVCQMKSCKRRFAESAALKRHFRIHTGERPFACHFPGCEKKFADPTNARRHADTHAGVKPFSCPVAECGRGFSRRSSLRNHMVSMHDLPPTHPDFIRACQFQQQPASSSSPLHVSVPEDPSHTSPSAESPTPAASSSSPHPQATTSKDS